MKKVITLILAAGLITTAAFAQDHRHSYDSRGNQYGYQTQDPAYNNGCNGYGNGYNGYDNGYNGYGNNWNRELYGKQFGYNSYDRDRYDRRMYRPHRRYYDTYRNRSGLSLQLIIGSHRRY